MHTVSVQFTDDLYQYFNELAAHLDRPVESTLAEMVGMLLGELPTDLDAVLSVMNYLSDEQLWTVVHQRLSQQQRERLAALSNNRRHLTYDETIELDALLDRIDRYTLLRSQALALLKQRGTDIDGDLKLKFE
jgi:hypothetical protein